MTRTGSTWAVAAAAGFAGATREISFGPFNAGDVLESITIVQPTGTPVDSWRLDVGIGGIFFFGGTGNVMALFAAAQSIMLFPCVYRFGSTDGDRRVTVRVVSPLGNGAAVTFGVYLQVWPKGQATSKAGGGLVMKSSDLADLDGRLNRDAFNTRP